MILVISLCFTGNEIRLRLRIERPKDRKFGTVKSINKVKSWFFHLLPGCCIEQATPARQYREQGSIVNKTRFQSDSASFVCSLGE